MLNQGGQQQQHGDKGAPISCGGGSGGGGSTASQLSYPKTKATTCGQDYEVALCSLFFLRALRVSSDFFLAGNYEPAGKFDDVVLFYRLKEDSDPDPAVYRAIFLQAKHKDGTKNTLTVKGLQEYLQSFKQIKKLWEQPLVIDGRQITLKKVFLVHSTNTGCAVDTVECDVDDLPDLQKFLNTGGRLLRIRGAPEELPEGKDTSDFLGKLLLCTKQMSVEATDKFLLDEMCKLLGLESLHVERELTSKLKSLVKTWWSTRGRGTFLTANSEEWQRILKMHVTRLNGDILAVDSRKLAFTEEALQQLDVVRRSIKMTWIPVSDSHQASMTMVRLLRARSDSLVLCVKYLDSHWAQVEDLWGKSVCQILVLDLTDYPRCEVSQLLQRLQEAAETDARRHLVVVATELPTPEGYNVVEPLEIWSALKTQTQHRLLSLKVELQGIPNVALRDVVGFSLSGVMTDEVIKSLSLSEPAIRLGEAMTTPPDYYVPRCLQRTSSKTITYQSLQNTNALLSYYEWDDNSSVDRNINRLTRDDLEKTNKVEGLILVREDVSNSEIRNMCCEFQVKGVRGRAEWEGLTGEVTEFIPITWLCEDDVVVVEGVPGVGKSSFVTQMCFVAKKEFPEAWVLRVDMARHTDYLQVADFSSPSDVMDFLLKAFRKDLSYLERHLLEHALRVTGNLFLFLDAFDEIRPDYTAQCCRLLKGIAKGVKYRQIVVTTRPVTTKYVEEALQTKAFTLPVVSREEIASFFTNFFNARGKAIDQKAIASFQHIAGDVIEIPLLCKMLAADLMNNQDESVFQYKDPWGRILLYNLFVEQTVKNHIVKELHLKDSMTGVRKLLESNITHHLRKLQGSAVRKLMPEVELSNLYDGKLEEKFGLVVDTGEWVDFEHPTFAKFFLGCWLNDNWRHCRRNHLRRLLLQDGFQFVAATLSWSLFQDLPLHLAVARGDAEAVRKELLLSSAGTTDRGGRSALHVAAMTPGCSREILELLVASGEDVNSEDAILAKPAVEYAVVARNWELIEIMLEKGATLENFNFLNNQEAAEEVLIHAIQRDLAKFIKCVLNLNKTFSKVRVGANSDTLLHVAARNGSAGVLKVLTDGEVEKNATNKDGDTAFTLAAKEGHFDTVKLLIESAVELNVININGDTAVMLAAMEGHYEIVKLLIENGVELNVINNNGDTAVMLAAKEGHYEVVKLLIESGVELNVRNIHGDTAVELASREEHFEIVRLLIECTLRSEGRDYGHS